MRSGAAAGHSGYFHETAFYGSDEELVAIALPFLLGGVAAGEPTVVTFGARNAALVAAALADHTGAAGGVTFLPAADRYARPAVCIRAYREQFARLVAEGAQQVRVVGDVPHPGVGVAWDGWARYEAVVNAAYDDFPIWGLCPYDLRTTPPDVLDEVRRTHPHIATVDGQHVRNDAFEDPAAFLAARPAAGPDPLQASAPAVVLADPSPRAARLAVVALAERVALPAEALADLVAAVSEVVANAALHGRPPCTLEAWGEPGRVVVAVRDAGQGPADPLVGLVPAGREAGDGGLGLWMAHQLCDDVVLVSDDRGFTVRLAAAG